MLLMKYLSITNYQEKRWKKIQRFMINNNGMINRDLMDNNNNNETKKFQAFII